jgi:hypothetical protein
LKNIGGLLQKRVAHISLSRWSSALSCLQEYGAHNAVRNILFPRLRVNRRPAWLSQICQNRQYLFYGNLPFAFFLGVLHVLPDFIHSTDSLPQEQGRQR